MEVTEVRVRLVGCGGTEKLLAFATVTFDNSFVVRDLRIITGANGLFVAMPSRKLTDRCPGFDDTLDGDDDGIAAGGRASTRISPTP